MADSKRQNAGGKAVVTPNMAPSNLLSLESALVGVIGARYVYQSPTSRPSPARYSSCCQ